jgi:hypothetical protein
MVEVQNFRVSQKYPKIEYRLGYCEIPKNILNVDMDGIIMMHQP